MKSHEMRAEIGVARLSLGGMAVTMFMPDPHAGPGAYPASLWDRLTGCYGFVTATGQ